MYSTERDNPKLPIIFRDQLFLHEPTAARGRSREPSRRGWGPIAHLFRSEGVRRPTPSFELSGGRSGTNDADAAVWRRRLDLQPPRTAPAARSCAGVSEATSDSGGGGGLCHLGRDNKRHFSDLVSFTGRQ